MSAVAGANRLPILVHEINAAHQACRRSTADTIRSAIEAGRGLNEAKPLVLHGEWEPWLKRNLPNISVRTAQRYMRVAARAGKNDTLSFFRLRDLTRPLRERFGYLGGRRVLILTPSAHLGFTHVTVVDVDTWEARGFQRPVRDDWVERVVPVMCTASFPTQWVSKRSREHLENPYLVGAERVATNEDKAKIEAVIAAADHRLDEFGYDGPRSCFAEVVA